MIRAAHAKEVGVGNPSEERATTRIKLRNFLYPSNLERFANNAKKEHAQLMSLNGNTLTSFTGVDYIRNVNNLVQWINGVLAKYSDKDWNYSRLRLIAIHVNSSQSPYLLGCELIAINTRQGQAFLNEVQKEISWGDYHSSELGVLELISLRLNKALVAVVGKNYYVSGDPPKNQHPVIRLVKRQDLVEANAPTAIWYEVQEVSGDEFDSR